MNTRSHAVAVVVLLACFPGCRSTDDDSDAAEPPEVSDGDASEIECRLDFDCCLDPRLDCGRVCRDGVCVEASPQDGDDTPVGAAECRVDSDCCTDPRFDCGRSCADGVCTNATPAADDDDDTDDDTFTGDDGEDSDDDASTCEGEVCDGTDNDCDGVVDDGCPGADDDDAALDDDAAECIGEICDGMDNDCDGVVDDGCPPGSHDDGEDADCIDEECDVSPVTYDLTITSGLDVPWAAVSDITDWARTEAADGQVIYRAVSPGTHLLNVEPIGDGIDGPWAAQACGVCFDVFVNGIELGTTIDNEHDGRNFTFEVTTEGVITSGPGSTAACPISACERSPATESCNGLDDDSDGVTDSPECFTSVYRFIKPDSTRRCLDTSPTGAACAGFVPEFAHPVFLLATNSISGTSTFSEFIHAAREDHHYTADPEEQEAIPAVYPDYMWQRDLGWTAFPTPPTAAFPYRVAPLYRLRHRADGHHFFTANAIERDLAVASGLYYAENSADGDGVAAYVWIPNEISAEAEAELASQHIPAPLSDDDAIFVAANFRDVSEMSDAEAQRSEEEATALLASYISEQEARCTGESPDGVARLDTILPATRWGEGWYAVERVRFCRDGSEGEFAVLLSNFLARPVHLIGATWEYFKEIHGASAASSSLTSSTYDASSLGYPLVAEQARNSVFGTPYVYALFFHDGATSGVILHLPSELIDEYHSRTFSVSGPAFRVWAKLGYNEAVTGIPLAPPSLRDAQWLAEFESGELIANESWSVWDLYLYGALDVELDDSGRPYAIIHYGSSRLIDALNTFSLGSERALTFVDDHFFGFYDALETGYAGYREGDALQIAWGGFLFVSALVPSPDDVGRGVARHVLLDRSGAVAKQAEVHLDDLLRGVRDAGSRGSRNKAKQEVGEYIARKAMQERGLRRVSDIPADELRDLLDLPAGELGIDWSKFAEWKPAGHGFDDVLCCVLGADGSQELLFLEAKAGKPGNHRLGRLRRGRYADGSPHEIKQMMPEWIDDVVKRMQKGSYAFAEKEQIHGELAKLLDHIVPSGRYRRAIIETDIDDAGSILNSIPREIWDEAVDIHP